VKITPPQTASLLHGSALPKAKSSAVLGIPWDRALHFVSKRKS
jgi:hypothetical protein